MAFSYICSVVVSTAAVIAPEVMQAGSSHSFALAADAAELMDVGRRPLGESGDPEAVPFSGSGYDLSWQTIDGGGGTSAGGEFVLSGTIGQPDAGAMSGGGYTLAGGFWSGSSGELPPVCSGDLNDDGVVNISDLLIVLSGWGACSGCAADLNGDGIVDFNDLLMLLTAWGPCP